MQAIWTTLEHGTSAYFHSDAALFARNARNAYAYLEAHGGNTLWAVRALLADVQWKLLAEYPDCLWKRYDPRISTSTERAAYNLMVNLPGELIPFERLNEKAR